MQSSDIFSSRPSHHLILILPKVNQVSGEAIVKGYCFSLVLEFIHTLLQHNWFLAIFLWSSYILSFHLLQKHKRGTISRWRVQFMKHTMFKITSETAKIFNIIAFVQHFWKKW